MVLFSNGIYKMFVVFHRLDFECNISKKLEFSSLFFEQDD